MTLIAPEKHTLPFHERLAAWLIISTTIFLIVINLIRDSNILPNTVSEHHLTKQIIEIQFINSSLIGLTLVLEKG